MVHTLRLLLVTLFLTFAGSSGGQALTLENRAGEKLVIAPELSPVESLQAVPTHQENGGSYDELAADRLSFQSEDPIANKILFAKQTQAPNPFGALAAAGSSSDGSPNATSEMQSTPFAAGDFNVSRYVGNAPLNHIDPTGLDAAEYEIIVSDVTQDEEGIFKITVNATRQDGDRYVYEITNRNEGALVNTYLRVINALREGNLPSPKDLGF